MARICPFCPGEQWTTPRAYLSHAILDHPAKVRDVWRARFGSVPVEPRRAWIWDLTDRQVDALLGTML